VQVNESHLNEIRDESFRTSYSRAVTPSLPLVGDSPAGRAVRGIRELKVDGFGYTLIGGCWPGMLRDRLEWASYVIYLEAYLAFSGWS
jgi:hypothetical protein